MKSNKLRNLNVCLALIASLGLAGVAQAATVKVKAAPFAYAEGDYPDGQPKPVSTYRVKGKKAINYVNKGDLVGYNIDIPESGVYQLSYSIATEMEEGAEVSFQVKQDSGWETYAPTTVKPQGGWDSFYKLDASAQIPLKAGKQEVRVVATGTNDWQWNLQSFELNKAGELAE
ncbi:carbohydrate-binding protein [Aliagarivorans marinus]|uniref:carbohydrate-binding protein n=1 Tax=Aliagarivorans marinus TaxID=561965 RepID=UPI000400A19E|nr:carbohydrate-binding protein [Aliagarivorans marinus]